ncbi:MAG: hypothetical protein HY926_05825 [Elusimicrobia bacterium]|nr:hypothetical protein [Elusimicrobiota bacterium]
MSGTLLALAAAVLVLAAPIQAQSRRRTAAPAKTSALDAQAFEQNYEMIFLLAGQAYLKDGPMPDPGSLEHILAALPEPVRGKARDKKASLERIISGAECVQGGPAGIPLEVYRLMVNQAAEDLKVGAIVEQDFVPNARAGRSLNAEEKSLVKTCQAEARDKPYDRRGFYQKCLGRRRCEAVYLPPARPARNAQAQPGPECGPVLESVAQLRSKLPGGLSDDVGRKLDETRGRLLSGSSGWDSLLGAGPASRQRRFGVAPIIGARVSAAPAKGAGGSGSSADAVRTDVHTDGAGDLKLGEPPLDSADLDAGLKLARVTKANEIGFTGYCYSYVKAALQKMGIVSRADIEKAGAAAHAKLFAEFVERNPALLKRKLRRIPEPSWPVPIGTIVIWSAGACGYSAKSGHIEIVTRIKPPQACSDGCGTFQTACLDQLGSDPPRARAKLPEVQVQLTAAQADYDATKTSAKRAALRRRQAALKAVEKRLEPQVAVYVVERQP